MASTSLSLSDLNSCLTAFEGVLNIAGYIPGKISRYSIRLRHQYGHLEFLLGTVAAVGSLWLSHAKPLQADLYKKAAVTALKYAGHGILNTYRAYMETCKLSTCLLLPYDIHNQKFLSYDHAQPQFDLQQQIFKIAYSFFVEQGVNFNFITQSYFYRKLTAQLDKIPTLIPFAIEQLKNS